MTTTVGELRALLAKFPKDLPVCAQYDGGGVAHLSGEGVERTIEDWSGVDGDTRLSPDLLRVLVLLEQEP